MNREELLIVFAGSDPNVLETYDHLAEEILKGKEFKVEIKSKSLHMVSKKAFLGVHPKRKWLDLNVVSDRELEHRLLRRVEQVSKNRFHNEFRLTEPVQFDQKLRQFIVEAHDLMS